MRGESAARPGKRPIKPLTTSEKVNAINRVHEGESKASVARDIGVPESTLRGWCKSEQKLKGTQKSSSTPDSDPNSPASSSGANAHAGSEDEGNVVSVPPPAKRSRLDSQYNANLAIPGPSNDCGNEASADVKIEKGGMDYLNTILGNMIATSVNPSDAGTLMMQQMGILNMTKSLMNLSNNSLPGISHLPNLNMPQTVGLVANGLQYTKSSSGLNDNYNGRSSYSVAAQAIAPTSQLDAVNKSCPRKSLSPAAEAPSTLHPASPRKTSEYQNGVGYQPYPITAPSSSSKTMVGSKTSNTCNSSANTSESASISTKSTAKATDDKKTNPVYEWLQQQQHILGNEQAQFNPQRPWFWPWYLYSGPTAVTPVCPNIPPNTPKVFKHFSEKSPSKVKATMDEFISNYNQYYRRYLQNSYGISSDDDEVLARSEKEIQESLRKEAIKCGKKMVQLLESLSVPVLSQTNIIQLKYIVHQLNNTSSTADKEDKPNRKSKSTRKLVR